MSTCSTYLIAEEETDIIENNSLFFQFLEGFWMRLCTSVFDSDAVYFFQKKEEMRPFV